MTELVSRARPNSLALETTLLVHGVPDGATLAPELDAIAIDHGAIPTTVGILDGVPIVGLDDEEMHALLRANEVPKVNTANLGLVLHRRSHGATTVSTTIELASRAGVRVFSTGALGGVHRDLGAHLDISADLGAVARHPVATVTAGVKSVLDVEGTREALETLGVPVVGWRTTTFPAFYRRGSDATVDATFDDLDDLASFIRFELDRTGRGIVVANPIEDELPADDWERWLAEAKRRTADATGRDVTPRLLGALHEISEGATLRANIALVRANVALGAQLAARLASDST